MGIRYWDIAKSVALAAGQLDDAADVDEYENLYQGNLEALLGGMEIPYTALRQVILDSEKRLVDFIGNCPNGLYRSYVFGRSNALASGDQIPTTDSGDANFVGTIGSFYDAATFYPCTPKPFQDVLRMNRLYAAGALKVRPFHFALSDMRVIHTRDDVFMETCVYDAEVAAAQYDDLTGLGESVLPLGMASFFRDDVLASAAQEDWFVQEAGHYAGRVTSHENLYRQGLAPGN